MSQSERALLQERADKMGIKYSPNIGLETLKERIHEKLKEEEPEYGNELENARKECVKLIRVSVTSLDNSKVQLDGEYFKVANGVCSVARYIPFNTPWHIEKILYDTLKEKKVQQVKSAPKGSAITQKSVISPAYAIEVLDPLTDKELESLANSQKARKSIED